MKNNGAANKPTMHTNGNFCYYNKGKDKYTGCQKKPPKTIENDLLLEFQCLALN